MQHTVARSFFWHFFYSCVGWHLLRTECWQCWQCLGKSLVIGWLNHDFIDAIISESHMDKESLRIEL